ncbi:hypothetical protein AMS68_006677 [Peltaster fructicola]|uniref:Uncharacterized protein n=1 Tax=Peltaster fructicola TaxID=286661 RepID=A0A6H0Y3E6_9PEZI|nr:hypothetical protein AMS68_006677 [Peltaster fructicola]
MADGPSQLKLSMRPKLTRIRVDETVGDHGDDFKAGWQKHKEMARGTVIDLFNKTVKNARKSTKKSERHSIEEERLGPRPVSRRVRATKSSVPIKTPVALDISDDLLDRLTSEPKQTRRPTSKFFRNQRKRAGIPDPSSSPPTQIDSNSKPLEPEDIIHMFAGAPYFDIEDTAGRRKLKISHGWAPATPEVKDSTDYAQPKHRSFEFRTIDSERSPRHARGQVREVPSMLSATGKDPGTVGVVHFSELQLRQAQHLDKGSLQRQHLLVTNPESLGLREFDIESTIDRLSELPKVYESFRDGRGDVAFWDRRMIEEIGEELFSGLLSADLGTTPAGTGSVSLHTQVAALQKVLSAEQVWFDFTVESWRNQLGQILWEPREVAAKVNERDVLLLQIALSAELAVRLEISQRLAAFESRLPSIFAPGDLESMLNNQTEKLDWDIVVFQRFLESFALEEDLEAGMMLAEETNIIIRLRKEQEGWDGLKIFANKIDWPENDAALQTTLPKFGSFLTAPIDDRAEGSSSEYETPRSSPEPPAPATPALVLIRSERSLLIHTAFDEKATISSEEGAPSFSWLTKSWLSGFFMPGAAVETMLLHTLLETSSGTKSLLPDATNNNDGFVHQRQMYWSLESVVGRVLAATADAKECFGWISLPFVPQGQGDGWIQAYAKEAFSASLEPRINAGDLISHTSDQLHCKDKLQPGDFMTIVEGHKLESNEVRFEGVSLSSSKVVQHTTDGFVVPKTVSLAFKSPMVPTMPALTLSLTHMVHFLSSYPCYSALRPRTGSGSPAHDSCAPIDSGRSTPMTSPIGKDLPSPPTHPLHVDYTYIIIPAAALLSSALQEVKDSDTLLLMASPDDPNPSIYQIEDQEVVVLDCRGSPDLEVLARAWAAKSGENALIGKKGRTCLACCIREAIGLGIGVVIRTE